MKRLNLYLILGSLLFQILLFLYLDQVVFAPAVSFTQRAVLNEEEVQIISSPDNTSFARLADGLFKIYSHEAGYVGKYVIPNEGKVTYFEYYPERNLAVAGTTLIKNGATTVICQEINTQNSQVTQWRLNGLAKGATIVESAYLGEQGTLHFLLREGTSTYLYRTATKELQRVKTNTTQINRIAALQKQGLLLFDNNNRGAIYYLTRQGEAKQLVTPKGSYALIGIDQEDRIYLGQFSEKKKITTLLAGNLDGGFVQVNKFVKPLDLSALRISVEGELLISP